MRPDWRACQEMKTSIVNFIRERGQAQAGESKQDKKYMRHLSICLIAAMLAGAAVLPAQTGTLAQPRPQPQAPPPPPAAASPQPAASPQSGPAAPAAQPAAQAASPVTQAQTSAPRPLGDAPFTLNGASLTEMIDVLAKQLKINYMLDPAVKGGSVTIYTYGEVKPVDLMPLLDTILRVNNLAMVQVGDLYRIVPIKQISSLPLSPTLNADPKTLPDDERMILNFVFLKYATAAEILKLIQPFLGEGATISSYDPANLLHDRRQQPEHEADHGADRHVRQRHLRRPAGEAVRCQQQPALAIW